MPTAIADCTVIKHDYISYSSKAPNHHYKPYPTRSFTNVQATQGSSITTNKPNLRDFKLKSGSKSSNLLLKDTTVESQSIQTFLPVEEEVPEQSNSDPVELQFEEVPQATTADPLYDIQQFYPSEHFSSNVRKIMKYLTGPTPAKSHMEFRGVRAREFKTLQHEVEETGHVFTKPRLTDDYNKELLTVDMPTILHESFYDDLKERLTLVILNFPYNRRIIQPQIHMNYSLQIRDKSFVPDLVVSLTPMQGATEVVLILCVGETTLTEQWDHVFEKMESTIAKHPEMILALIILVWEVKRYASPPELSATAETLHNCCDDNDEEPQPISLQSFINMHSTPQTFEEPTKVADHTWCHIKSVEYFMWIKGKKDKPIDMQGCKPEHRAHSTLVPGLHMNNIMKIIDQGLSMMQDLFIKFQKQIDPAIDCSVLEKFVIPPFPIDWELGAFGVMSTIDLTAHSHYIQWHAARFRGMKHERDSSYAPLESEDNHSSVAGVDDSNPKPASASTPRIPIPSHHMFRTVMMGSTVTPAGSTSSTPLQTAVASKSKVTKAKMKKPHHNRGPNKHTKH